MIMQKNQKEEIAKRIDFIQIQLGDLAKIKNLDWKTYSTNRDVQRNIERLAENVANATIDICKIVLAGVDVEIPNSYKDIILALGTKKILPESLSQKLAEFAKLRNFLAHEYLDLRWEKIKDFIKNAQVDFAEFIKNILQTMGE